MTLAHLLIVCAFAAATLAGACAAPPSDTAARTEATAGSKTPVPVRPVATFSIVAREASTGNLGVAVQSHWFSVGTIVPWARADVGAVATQSLVDVRYGPLGLDLMGAGGRTAEQALLALTASDEKSDVRQVAMVDAHGNVAVHTGEHCIAVASDVHGTVPDGSVYSCQANMMDRPGVPEAMAHAFETTTGDLAARLMAALDAAQGAGGDIRGKQSAAMLIVSATPTEQPWKDRLVDLRIDDNPEPLKELRRILTIHRAYEQMNQGDLALEHNDLNAALRHYAAAEKLAPDVAEVTFWTGVTLAATGHVEESFPHFQRAFADDADWRKLLERLPAAGVFPDDPDLIKRITSLPAANTSPATKTQAHQ